MKPAFQVVIILTIFLAIAGCGQRLELGQVTGTVKAGGKPLPGVVVTFVPNVAGVKGLPSSLGQTDEQGRYLLRTEKQQAGAVLGQHRVVVEDLAIFSAPRSEDGTILQRPPARFSAEFSNLLKTPLTFEVKAGEQTIDLELTAAQDKSGGLAP